MSHRNVLSVALVVVLVVMAALTSTPVAASEHTVELQSGNTYWYGQILEYNDSSVTSGEDWTLRGVSSGNTLTVSAGQDGTVQFDSKNLASDSSNLQAEDLELVDPSGNVVMTVSIDFQTLSPQSFTTDPVYNDGADTNTSIDINSNRSNTSFDILITETNGKLTGDELAGLSDNLTKVDSSTAQVTNVTGNTTLNLDFQGISADSYTFEFSTDHTVEQDGSGGLVSVSGTQSITVEDATGSVSGSIETEDTDYSGDITLTLEDQNSSNSYSKTLSGSSVSYTFNDVPVGTYNLTANADRHQSVTLQDIAVENNTTTNPPSTTLPLKDTFVEISVDVDTLDGNTYDRDLTVTLEDSNGNVVGEQEIPDETTASFTVDSTGDYTATVNDRFVEESTATVTVSDRGTTYTTTMTPLEQEHGELEVTASTETSAEEIRVNVVSTSNDTSRTLRIDGDSGTVTEDFLTGDYEVTVDAIGHVSQSTTVTISNGATVSKSFTLDEKTVAAEDGGQYWVGQKMDFSQYVSDGDSVRFRNRETNEVYQPAVDDASDFIIDTNNIQSAAGTGEFVFSVNDNPQIEFTLSEQNLSSSFTSSVTLGGDLETSLTASSERSSQQTLRITEIVTPDGTSLDGSMAAELDTDWKVSGTNAYTTINSSEVFFNFDMSQAPFDLVAGDYVFKVEVADTGAMDDATLTVEESSGTDLSSLVGDKAVQESGLYWTGQVVYVPSDQVDSDTTYRILKDDTLVEELQPRSSDGKLIFDTSWDDFGEGDYSIEDSQGNILITEFLVREQEFSAEFESDTVLNTGVQTEANVAFDSNRSAYPVIVELDEGPQDLSATAIANRVASADVKEVTIDGEKVPKAVITDAGSESELIQFKDLTEGTYTFTFDVVDSTASTTASIDVSGLEEGKPEFSRRVYTANQGDVATFDIVMAPGVDETTLLIGNNDTGYYAELKLTDPQPNTATIATVRMDTTHAGQGTPDRAFSVTSEVQSGEQQEDDSEDGSTDTSTDVQLEIVEEKDLEVPGLLSPTRYLMQLETDGTERDISAFELKQLNAELKGIYVIPQTTTLEELRQKANSTSGDDEQQDEDDSDVEQTTKPFFGDAEPSDGGIPKPDTGVIAIKLNGLGSQLYQDGLSASDFQEGSATVSDTGAYIEVEQTSDSELNRADDDIPVSALDYRFNKEAGYIYFIVKPTLIPEAQIGQTFNFTFTVDERNSAIGDGQREPIKVEKQFTITETGVDWGMEPLQVEPESEQPITAKTSYTPGTEMRMVVLSYETGFPYFQSVDTEVKQNGNVVGTFDFNGAPLGTELEVILRNVAEPHPIEVVDDAERPDFAKTLEPEDVTLTVNVEDTEGNSVDASVTVDGTTKEGSNTEFTVPTETDVEVEASAEEYNSSSKTVSIATSDKETTLTLQPIQEEEEEEDQQNEEDQQDDQQEEQEETFEISVEVLDSSTDQPIEGATVSFGDRSRQTGSDGTVTIQLTSGTYEASISADGYSGITQDVSISSDDSYDITLDPEDGEGSEDGSDEEDGSDSEDSNDEEGSSDDGSSDDGSSDSEDDSVRSEGQNGFGILVALVAVGAVLVARRVRN